MPSNLERDSKMHASHQDPCCLELRQASSIWMSVIPHLAQIHNMSES